MTGSCTKRCVFSVQHRGSRVPHQSLHTLWIHISASGNLFMGTIQTLAQLPGQKEATGWHLQKQKVQSLTATVNTQGIQQNRPRTLPTVNTLRARSYSCQELKANMSGTEWNTNLWPIYSTDYITIKICLYDDTVMTRINALW